MTFQNDVDKELEGELIFPLPEGNLPCNSIVLMYSIMNSPIIMIIIIICVP